MNTLVPKRRRCNSEDVAAANIPAVRIRRRPGFSQNVSVTPAPVNSETRPQRADAAKRHQDLCELIAHLTKTEPYEFEGQTWAAGGGHTQKAWAKAVGLPLRTFKRLVRVPPIVTETRGARDRKVTFLRVGEPVSLDEPGAPRRKVRNALSKAWREYQDGEKARRDRKVGAGPVWTSPGKDFGLICGLSDDLPDGWQLRIFKHTLQNWSGFCGCLRGELRAAEAVADMPLEDLQDGDHMLETARVLRRLGKVAFSDRFHAYPSLPLMRLFHHVMTDLYVSDMGLQGRDYPGRVPAEPGAHA